MSTGLLPDFDALVVEEVPEVLVDDTEFELAIEVQVPAVELRRFAIEILDDAIALTCGDTQTRLSREFELPPGADTAHITASLDDGVLELRIPKLPRHYSREPHIPGFHPDATPC